MFDELIERPFEGDCLLRWHAEWRSPDCLGSLIAICSLVCMCMFLTISLCLADPVRAKLGEDQCRQVLSYLMQPAKLATLPKRLWWSALDGLLQEEQEVCSKVSQMHMKVPEPASSGQTCGGPSEVPQQETEEVDFASLHAWLPMHR